MTFYAVIALIKVDDSITHEKVYDLVDKSFQDSDELWVQYRDVDPNWRSFPVLAENADVEDEWHPRGPSGWGVEMWGTGWEPVADGFVTQERAEGFMAFLASHRVDGTTGLRVINYAEVED